MDEKMRVQKAEDWRGWIIFWTIIPHQILWKLLAVPAATRLHTEFITMATFMSDKY